MKKIDGLTSLRAIAALWVSIGHFYYQVPVGASWAEGVLRVGGLGVTLFFVLSGFILSHTYQAKFVKDRGPGQWRTYAISRFARVYPVHLTMLCLFAFVLVPVGVWPSYFYDTTGSFIASLALVHAWGLYPVPVWNQPSWTISVEFICYAGFPLLAVWFSGLAGWRSLMACAGVLAAFAVGTLVFQSQWIFYFPLFIVKYCGCFIGGCLLYRVYATRKTEMSATVTFACVAISIAGIALCAHLGSRFEGVVPIFFALWIYSLAAGAGPARALFETRPFVYAGEISYSYFLAHEAALLVLLKVAAVFGLVSADLPIWTKIAAGLVFAVPLYHFVEEPARRLIRSGSAPKAVPASA